MAYFVSNDLCVNIRFLKKIKLQALLIDNLLFVYFYRFIMFDIK